MASPCETSPGSIISIQNSDEKNQHGVIMDQRKWKRMISNRESARRSRMRKQNHLDDLITQVNQLSAEKSHMLTNLNVVSQLYLNTESENSVLRAQMSELTHRLQTLNDIVSSLSASKISPAAGFENDYLDYGDCDYYNQMINGGDYFLNDWSLMHINQPIMASADAFMY